MGSAPVTMPVGPASAQVYAPAPVGKPHAVIHNSGPGIVYLGQSGVTQGQGLPLRAKETVELPNGVDAIYAVCGGLILSGTVTTTTTAAITHGASTTVAVTAITGFAAKQVVQVGAGTAAETLTISSTSTAPSVTFTSKPVLDHVSGAAMTLVTGAAAGTLRVSTGST
jgi:hypothetical protein